MVEFKLPDVGEGMREAEVVKWLVKEGEAVTRDQPVVEINTDKVSAELTSPADGLVGRLSFAEGDIVPVGAVLFAIEDGRPSGSADIAPPRTARRTIASPYVRQMARTMELDLDKIAGTGPGGLVTEADLHAFAASPQEHVAPLQEHGVPLQEHVADRTPMPMPAEAVRNETQEERIPLRGMRRTIAEHMVKSVSVIPHVTHVDEMEMDALVALRDRLKGYAEERNARLTYLPFFVKAVALALRQFPYVNASLDERTNEIVLKRYCHIGIAMDTGSGLVVPVVKDADRKTVLRIAEEIGEFMIRSKEGTLSLESMSGSTFTISNMGPIGGLYATPIIHYPNAAILALHKMEPRMVVRNMEGVIRFMMNFSLSFDHRLLDGVTAVRFTNRMKQLLEHPDFMFLEMS